MDRRLITIIVRAACLFALIVTLGCQRPSGMTQVETPNDTLDAVTIVADSKPTDEQRKELLAAKDALFQSLSRRLMEAMSQGPAQAIVVCQKEATQIAAAVAEEQGVKIGRVGVRLRNLTNTGPAWAAPLIESRTETPVFANLSNGHAAALLPIKLQAQCLMCHGPTEQIPPAIKQELVKLYPEDQAVNFREGELRGWFWVEKPSS